MTTDKFLSFSRYAFVAAISAISGLSFALFLEVGYPLRTDTQPEWCSSIGWLCHIYEWQTLVAGAIAVVATLIAAKIAWSAVQKQIEEQHRQIDEQRLQELKQERNELQRFQSFANDLAEELTSYRQNLTAAERALRKKTLNFELTVQKFQRIPFSIPIFADWLFTYKTRISLEALNSYILQHTALLDRLVKERGLKFFSGEVNDDTLEHFDRLLHGLERTSKQVLEDLAEFDATKADDRIHEIDRIVGKI